MVFPLHFFSSFFLVKHLFFTQPTQLFTLFIKSFQKLRYILRLHIDNINVTNKNYTMIQFEFTFYLKNQDSPIYLTHDTVFFDKELQDFIINEDIFDINDIQQVIIDRI